MFYYEVLIVAHALAPLTYHSQSQIKLNSFVKVNLRGKESLALVYKEVEKPSFQTLEIKEELSTYLTPFEAHLLNFMSYYYSCEPSICAGLFEPFEPFKFSENQEIFSSTLPELNEEQKKAFDFCLEHDFSLIFGDTGCGKSEIYINAIAKTLNEGKQALLLMPEIALTPQMKIRLEKYFKGSLGIWHSGISKAKKKELLQDFLKGKIRLIAGARSALFLPFSDLGLIVVDEEHDESYKNSAKPAYNARDLALYLAKNPPKNQTIKTILGSATPSATSYFKIPFYRIKGTYFKSSKKYIFDPHPLGLSKLIIAELSKVLEAGRQAVVFLPTRGNFKRLECKECNQKFLCPFCAVSMSLHKNSNALKCHYCGYACVVPKSCPSCGSEVFEASKLGTSELKEMLQKALPNAKIAKFDRDEITTAKKLEKALKDFNDGQIDILVGTQMLSKGHDYHNVELAVVLGLDEHLCYADFRAREKTLALAIQIAGRAGRATEGKIIIQTREEKFFGKYLSDFEGFLKEDLELRKPLYPPFARLMRILIAHKNENLAQSSQNEILNQIANIKDLEIIGYGKAQIACIASKHRYSILLRSHSHSALIKAGNIAKTYNALADIDPLNFS